MVLNVHEEVLGDSSESEAISLTQRAPELACNCTGKDNVMVVAKQEHPLFAPGVQGLKTLK